MSTPTGPETRPPLPLPGRVFAPRTGTTDEWNEAYERLEDYLRAHRLHRKLSQQRLILEILARAAARHEADPARPPVALALEEASSVFVAAFGPILGREEVPADRLAVAGRLAALVADEAPRLDTLLLDPESVPDDLRERLRRSSVQAGPDLAVSSMVPRDIDLGPLPGLAGQTWATLERWPVLRLLLLWAGFLAILTALFVLTR